MTSRNMALSRKWSRRAASGITSTSSCDVIDCHCTNSTFIVVVLLALIGSVQADEYCQWETFNATCAHSHVILITSAVYGRMRIGRCVPYDYFVGCSTDVYDQLAARCSGRQHCSVPIPDTELFKVHPCRKDLVAYMEASYQCVPVAGVPVRTETSTTITPCNGEVPLTGPSGYLSGTIARRTGYGSERCPWAVRAPAGQRIELTVYDFGLDTAAATSTAHGTSSSSGGVPSPAAAPGIQQRQSQQQSQRQQQQRVTSQHTSPSQQQQQPHQSAVASYDNIGVHHVHCHVVAVYYEGDTTWSSTSPARITSSSVTPSNIHPVTATTAAATSARRRTSNAKSSEGEPHHLRLCPSIAGYTSARVSSSIASGAPLDHRKKVVYRSSSNQLFIYTPNMTANNIKHHYVMLRYDVVGCPDPELPTLTWMLRRGDTVTVFCNQTAERWHLVCKGNDWIGAYSNCTRTMASHKPEQPQKYVRNFPLGLLVAIAIGVISGVVVGFILLIAIFTCRKRFNDSDVRIPPTTEHSVLLVNYENRQNAYKLIDFNSTAATTTSSNDHYTSTILQNGSPSHWPLPPGMLTSSSCPRRFHGTDRSSQYGSAGDQTSSKSPPMSAYEGESTLPDVAVSPLIGLDMDDEAGDEETLRGGPVFNADCPDVGHSPSTTAVVVYPADVYVTREILRLNESPRRIGLGGGNFNAPNESGCQTRNRHHQCYQSHVSTAMYDVCDGRACLSRDRCHVIDDSEVQQSIYGGIHLSSSTVAPSRGSSAIDCCGSETTSGHHCCNEQHPVDANHHFKDDVIGFTRSQLQ